MEYATGDAPGIVMLLVLIAAVVVAFFLVKGFRNKIKGAADNIREDAKDAADEIKDKLP